MQKSKADRILSLFRVAVHSKKTVVHEKIAFTPGVAAMVLLAYELSTDKEGFFKKSAATLLTEAYAQHSRRPVSL